MKLKSIKIMTVLALASLSLSACGAKKSGTSSVAKSSTASAQASMAVPQDMLKGKFKAADSSWEAKKDYEFKKMGLKFSISDTLLEKLKNKEIALLPEEELSDDQTTKFARFTFRKMNEKQREEEVDKAGDAYVKWQKSLEMEGSIGIFKSDIKEEEIAKITACTDNKKIGETKDGKYNYYLSTNSKGDSSIIDEIKKINVEITDKEEIEKGHSVFQVENAEVAKGNSVAPLKTKTINGEEFTDSDFSKYDVTMVNVLATWCGACVGELPEIQKAYEAVKDKGVNIVGVVTDTFDGNGENSNAIETSKVIAEKAGVKFPLLLPDSTQFNGRLVGIQALPETFFVDKNGNIIGEPVSGARSADDWKAKIEEVLNKVKGN